MSNFGGGFFGKPVPLAPGAVNGGGPLPVVKQGAQPQQLGITPGGSQGGPLGVVPPPPAGSVLGPQGPVPMGKKGDCPICRG